MNTTPANPDASGADPEFITWVKQHEHEKRLHAAQLAQITTHPDDGDGAAALEEQQAWARRRDHEQHLHDSAIDQISHPHPEGA